MGDGTMNQLAFRSATRLGAPPRSGERGVVLFIALIILVAMTLAGIAMFRQVGTGVIIAGNLAFRENATSVADMGLEAARTWLVGQTSAALNTAQAPGYFECSMTVAPNPACAQAGFNPATFDWSNNSVQVTADDGTGNEVRYVIHRLCAATGSPTVVPCATLGAAGAGGSRGGGAYGVLPLTNTVQPYFRVTARTTGPRNTVSYVQEIMY
jgi:type IV pilus assembly protein PilX